MLVTTFFKFVDLTDQLETLQKELSELEGLTGLLLLSTEGINATVAGEPEAVERLRDYLEANPALQGLEHKESTCEKNPYRRWKVDIRDQLIQYKEGFHPDGLHNHMSPAEWHATLNGDEPVTVLDTRNKYETKVGTFENAIDPEIDKFTEFADYLDTCDLPKDQKTLIYCTGGIRCEKAILDMEERGFTDVHQLHGGILKYIEEFPEEKFQGECFVFDHRVAVGQHLEPSEQYWMCPLCGDPGQEKLTCAQCGGEALLCEKCAPKSPVCSKDCRYHWLRVKAR